jgi:hypothetical protein
MVQMLSVVAWLLGGPVQPSLFDWLMFLSLTALMLAGICSATCLSNAPKGDSGRDAARRSATYGDASKRHSS